MSITQNRIDGMVYGFAFGDAWGYVTEFMKYKKIIKQKVQPPQVLKVSDDTQMSLYNLKAIHDIMEDYDAAQLMMLDWDMEMQDDIRIAFADRHVDFFYDKNNNRAPGMTCMTALDTYANSDRIYTGLEGSSTNNSNGCGTVMRAPWFGALPYGRETIAYLAILQAQTTHGSSTGWIASALTALLTRDLLTMDSDSKLGIGFIHHAISVLNEIESMDSNLVLGAQDGIDDLRGGLSRLVELWDEFLDAPWQSDMTQFFGEGWVADEALYNAIVAVAAYSSWNVHEGMQRLVWTNGDSDSLAAIGGAFLGALKGYDSLGHDVKGHIENLYQRELSQAAEDYLDFSRALETVPVEQKA